MHQTRNCLMVADAGVSGHRNVCPRIVDPRHRSPTRTACAFCLAAASARSPKRSFQQRDLSDGTVHGLYEPLRMQGSSGKRFCAPGRLLTRCCCRWRWGAKRATCLAFLPSRPGQPRPARAVDDGAPGLLRAIDEVLAHPLLGTSCSTSNRRCPINECHSS